ncbi:PTS sugar transporter subunit IIA [Acidithiobacillus sulfuriphilus]|uniref:PTS sugar transporter subunit IIA n=2 Tax=Acidithiobacillus sulfuriphilus TaxID=1867749 RepID=A0A3M8RBD2_9PROT|nr:PTS sugar transporter subunit IIA [Acidithiobacillus sulfuriphilus]RNF65928.1 PTS sugar transporter subunit IIA [Acidithiobacillus sulfuriphilus]
MIGLLLLTHDEIGQAFLAAVTHIFGSTPPALTVLEILPDQGLEESRLRLRQALERLDEGDGVLVLTDLFGATPSNLLSTVLRPGRVEAVSGLNLPMLLRGLSRRPDGLTAAREGALDGAHQGIVDLTTLTAQR